MSEKYYCADCDAEMVEDHGAGWLCPVCDEHNPNECGIFACSGVDGGRCALNE
jgi:hypothetical protein